MLDDPRFADWFLRKEHEPELRAIIEEALAAADSRTWETRLNPAGAPSASIWRVEDVIDHPQIVARDALQEVDTPYGRLRLMGSGFQLAHGGGRLDHAAPAIGAHTGAVLAEAGYGPEQVAALRAAAVI